MTTTKKKGPTKPRTRKPAVVPKKVVPVIPAESPNGQVAEVEDEWATSDMIGVLGYRDEQLPVMKKKVRIRFLTNIEATQLALLPDLQAFANIMSMLETSKKTLTPEEDRQLRIERMTYLTRVAHMAVLDTNAPREMAACQYCEGIEHLPSLWTPEQTKYLHPTDLGLIGAVAERGFELERVRPLSKDQTQSPTSTSASIGESTPAATS